MSFLGSGIQDIMGDVSSVRSTFKKRRKPDRRDIPRPAGRYADDLPSFKRGGTMKRRGVAKLHKGERIMSRKGRGRSR